MTAQILDVSGKPFAPSRARMLAGSGFPNSPYDAADIYDAHMSGWNPYLGSPDGEISMYRDRIVARVRDLVRNDGWASGGVTRILDNAVGAKFRPVFKPDYRMLAAYSGSKAFDADWADEFGRAMDGYWRTWANDPGRYSDVQRNLTIPQLMRLAFRHKLIDGDALAQMVFIPQRVGPGRAPFATAALLIDPDRMSNPANMFDMKNVRGGVEIDTYGAAIAYHIRRAHMGDWFAAADSMHWDRIPRETAWGRPVIVHDFDHERAGEHRGGRGIFTAVLQRLKMLAKYDATELDASIINAIFGAYVESPFDSSFVEDAMTEKEGLNGYQKLRTDFHQDGKMAVGNVRMPMLFPGEKIQTVSAARPSSNFADFEKAVLRNVASATGLSAQQLSQDWSDVNYSSARAALLESWKTISRRRDDFAAGFAQPMASCLVEEAMDRGLLPLPAGAPEYIECRAAYARALWMGPGRGWVDPVAEVQGSVMKMEAGLSTLEMECMEQGDDYEDNLDQRKREMEAFKERGLEPPVSWLAATAPQTNQQKEAGEKPQPKQ